MLWYSLGGTARKTAWIDENRVKFEVGNFGILNRKLYRYINLLKITPYKT
jgi:hypothetical protein